MERRWHRRFPTLVFWGGALGLSVWLFVVYTADMWFMFDDWTWLGVRLEVLETDGFAAFLLRPHNEHLMLGMILWDVGLARTFGLNSYLPWMVTVVIAWVGSVWVVRRVMLDLGVRPLVAAAVAVALLVWAPFDMVPFWAPETIFALTTALLLAHLVLVDHDGPVGWRDLLGAAASTAAVLIHSSAVIGIAVIAGGLVLRRRGAAATVAGAPVPVYLAWWAMFGGASPVFRTESSLAQIGVDTPGRDVPVMLRFMWRMLGSILWPSWWGIAAVVMIAGVAFGWSAAQRRGGRAGWLSTALVVMAAGYLAAMGWERSILFESVDLGPPGRYVVVLALLLVPLAVLGAQELVTRHSARQPRQWVAAALVIAVLAVGWSLRQRSEEWDRLRFLTVGGKERVLSLVRSPELDRTDPSTFVFGDTPFVDLQYGDLLRLRDAGWIR